MLRLATATAAASTSAGKRRGGKQYNPWTHDLQRQLATALRLALRWVMGSAGRRAGGQAGRRAGGQAGISWE